MPTLYNQYIYKDGAWRQTGTSSESVTYTMSLSGNTLTLTGSDGSTSTAALESGKIPYGVCGTAADTAAKEVTVSPAVTSLETGLTIAVKFTYANGIANPTLNVNSLGAISLKRYGTAAPSTSASSSWNAGAVVILVYDGTYWQMEDWLNTTYSSMTDAEITAGTGTTARIITPARLKSAIQTWAIPNTTSIPSKTSDLTNDSGFITTSDIPEGSAASTTTPIMDGTATTGTELAFARGDHVHPTDTSRAAASHAHGNITSAGDITTTATIASGDRIIINDESASKVTNSSITFGTSTAKYLSNAGTWVDTPSVPTKVSDLTNDSGFITGGTVSQPTFTGTQATINSSFTPAGNVTITSGSGTANYTPAGTVSQPTFTGTEGNVSVSGTPAGSVTIGTGNGTANYTPAGSISVTPTVTVNTTTVNSITNVGTLPSCTMPNLTTSYSDGTLTLTWTAGSFDAGTLPTKGANTTVATGIKSATASGSFTGTGVQLTGTFSGNSLTSTGTFTPAGTVSQPTFTGTGTKLSGTFTGTGGTATATYTPAGSVSQPTFTGTDN